jgi:esterase/lipase superfamily enzyme
LPSRAQEKELILQRSRPLDIAEVKDRTVSASKIVTAQAEELKVVSGPRDGTKGEERNADARDRIQNTKRAEPLKKEKYTIVRVYFATDRKKSSDKEIMYGNDENSQLGYGVVTISVPSIHTPGEIEKAKWYKFEFSPKAEKHFVLKRHDEMDEKSFIGSLKNEIQKTSRNEVFVFIHGFRTSFSEAAYRTAQIAYDVEFTGGESLGVPIMYSWPTQEELSIGGYVGDLTRVKHTRPNLEKFLTLIASNTGATKINVIAHSMGTDLFSQAVHELALKKKIPQFNQIVLQAPDIDQEVFLSDIAPNFKEFAKQTTIYASSNDKAMDISYSFNQHRRLGDSTDGPFVVDGFDTVDVSNVDLGLIGHETSGARSVMNDIYGILVKELPPLGRQLDEQLTDNGKVFWKMPCSPCTAE